MNKYVSMFLKVLKYIGIFLLVVYLYLVVNWSNLDYPNENHGAVYLDNFEVNESQLVSDSFIRLNLLYDRFF